MKKVLSWILLLGLLGIFLPNKIIAISPTAKTDKSPAIASVIYEGRSYTAAEFDKIAVTLNLDNAVYMPADSIGKEMYVFKDHQEFAHHFNPNGTLIFSSDNQTSDIYNIIPLDETVGYGYNWVNINKGGNCLALQEDDNRPDLSEFTPSWSYVISSCDFPYDPNKSTNYCMCLSPFPDSIYTLFAVPNGYYVPSLVSYYWYYNGVRHSWNDAACGIYWVTVN